MAEILNLDDRKPLTEEQIRSHTIGEPEPLASKIRI